MLGGVSHLYDGQFLGFFPSAAKQWGCLWYSCFLKHSFKSCHTKIWFCWILFCNWLFVNIIDDDDDDDDDDEFVLFSRFTVTTLHSGFVKLRFHHVFVLPTCRLQLSHLFGLGHRVRTPERVQFEIPLFSH